MLVVAEHEGDLIAPQWNLSWVRQDLGESAMPCMRMAEARANGGIPTANRATISCGTHT